MTRVIPFITTNKKNKNTNSISSASMMFQSMDMHDLGLGSLPDLLFAEQLDVVPQQQDDANSGASVDNGPVDAKQQQQPAEMGLLDGAQQALFKDLEDLNDQWQGPKTPQATAAKVKSAGMKASSTANILSQALKECDLASFINDNQVYIDQLSPAQTSEESEDEDNSMDTQQKLIDDMEDFLTQHEFGGANSTWNEGSSSSSAAPLTETESKEAEDILDALIAGNITLDDSPPSGGVSVSSAAPSPQTNQAVEAAIAQDDSGYLSNISNISEVVTADGQKVVIIIANDLQQEQSQPIKMEEDVQSPAETSYESDPDWSPDSPKDTMAGTSRPKRASNPTWKARKASEDEDKKKEEVKSGKIEKKKRGPYKRATYQNIKDKKERKKAQNVEAARRYRDKKKLEAENVYSEEAGLAARNKELKSKVSEMENEMKTLKKLMVELGLVKA